MSSKPSLIQLVTEVLDSGRSPEEVCGDWPDCLAEVRRRVARCRELDSRLDAVFPSSAPESDGREFRATSRLPEIPLYEVQALVGHGGMGVVYRAHHVKLKRLVALKMLRSGAYASPSELGRFSLEAEAIAALHHPHIVQVFDLGEVNGRPYFTMEYLDGGSLAEKLAGAPLPPTEAARHLVTLATAMFAAHQAGIVHRDLKPANVLFGPDGQLKISDFGLARRMATEDGLTFGGARIGTPSYMAPEQAAGNAGTIGPTADIYALGAILYEMLTGRPPFRGASAAETERQVINDEPAAPRRLNTAVPRDLETICLKCLRKDPAHRYATAADLAADADRHLRGEPIHARPVGAIERAIKWTRRRPAQAISIAASLILVIGLSGGALWFLSARSARTRIVTADLELVDGPDGLERNGKWEDARTELQRAAFELGNHGPAELHWRLAKDNHDLDLVAQLDTIDLSLANVAQNLSQTEIEDAYRPVYKDAGLELFTRDETATEAWISKSPIRVAIVAALNDWALVNKNGDQILWLRRVAGASNDPKDPPTALELQLRDRDVWQDWKALEKIAWGLTPTQIAKEPASSLVMLGKYLVMQDKDPKSLAGIKFLVTVQEQHPNDFWVNLTLGEAEFRAVHYEDAIEYWQVAAALRPTVSVPRSDLAYALFELGRDEEGFAQCQRAVELGSSSEIVHVNQDALAAQNAIQKLREISQKHQAALAKSGPTTHPGNLQALLDLHGFVVDAPRDEYSMVHGDPARARLETRWEKQKVTLDANPPAYSAWNGYAELCLYLQHEDEYRRTRTRLLERFGGVTEAHTAERIGRACLLLPGSDDEIRKATTLVDRAVNADKSKLEAWAGNFFQVAKALAEYRQGHLDNVMKILTGLPVQTLQPMPQFIMAMVLQQQGDTEEARRRYDAAVTMFDWNPNRATNADAWMFQVIRREAEEMIMPPSTRPGRRP